MPTDRTEASRGQDHQEPTGGVRGPGDNPHELGQDDLLFTVEAVDNMTAYAVEMYRSHPSQGAEALWRQRAVDATTVGVTGAALDVSHALQASDHMGQP